MLKNYPNMSLDYVLYEMSYQNLILYSSIIPGYDFDRKKKKRGKGSLGSILNQKGNAGGLKGLFNTLQGM